MRYQVVLFDLDGTLTDPTVGITRSVQYALSKLGIEAAAEELRSFIGPPLLASFRLSYSFDEATARLAVDYYREYFGERGIHENVVFPGVAEMLGELRAAGMRLCVVTSKPTFYSEQIVRTFGLEAYFDAVFGSHMDLSDAEKTVLVKRALAFHPERAASAFVMVGDREHDIIGARANGIASIGVTYGAGSQEELVRAGADRVVDSVRELGAVLLA